MRGLRTAGAGLALSLAAAWLLLSPVVWVLRDGLGPDAERSRGLAAVPRFLSAFGWGWLGLAVLGLVLLTRPWSAGGRDDPAAPLRASAWALLALGGLVLAGLLAHGAAR